MRSILLSLALLWALPVQAQLEITIDGGSVTATPIAVVPFAATSTMTITSSGAPGQAPSVSSQTINASFSTDIAKIVQSDLESSGLFAGAPRSAMLESPSSPSAVDYSNWKSLGRDYLIIGSASKAASGLISTQFHLLDVLRQQEVMGFAMPAVPESQLRDVAHQISDLIFERLTGTRGVFSTEIAYITASGFGFSRKFELLIADVDGYNPRTAVTSREPLLSPVWSPDGSQIAYVGFEQVRSAVWLYTPETGERRKVVSEKGINGAPAFSPDGKKLLVTLSFETNADIYEIDLASGNRKRLTNHRAIDTEASYSPDGSQIAFTSDRGGSAQVYVMNADGSNPKRVSFMGKQNLRPRFSPDGKKIAVVNGEKGRYTIALVNLTKGNAMTKLTAGPQEESPSFAPNGAVIMFASANRSGASLGTVSVDGKVQQSLRQSGEVREPAWGPFLTNAAPPIADAAPAPMQLPQAPSFSQ